MCDHCAKVTGQKGYAGQVTCRCERRTSEKKDSLTSKEEKDFPGCCSKKGKVARSGCCGAKCCAGTKEEHGGCCSNPNPSADQKNCCSTKGKAREAAGGCCMSGCCKQRENGKGGAAADTTKGDADTAKRPAEGCCAETDRK